MFSGPFLAPCEPHSIGGGRPCCNKVVRGGKNIGIINGPWYQGLARSSKGRKTALDEDIGGVDGGDVRANDF
ncbi:hypothetical protein FACS1894124_5690 [Spirochaetia bacterium]|nr:hypothetical protein FACS1894124_5690 [Spirochaetia bacterium]